LDARSSPESSLELARLKSLPQIAARRRERGCPNNKPHNKPLDRAQRVSVTISGFVTDAKQAKRFFVAGSVQGVGFRYYTQGIAERLRLSGYVRNLEDGRVEAYAVGTPEQLAELRSALQRGPRFASVSEVNEEPAAADPQYANEFIITHNA